MNLFSKHFDDIIWKMILSVDGRSLIFDIRDEDEKKIRLEGLDIHTLKSFSPDYTEPQWWSNIEGFDGSLYLSEYQDKNDPSHKKYFQIDKNVKTEIQEGEVPNAYSDVSQPFIYEPGSSYFKTVSEFLNLDLPCACEYMEIGNKIIMSYYLRSGKEFDRYMMILKGGQEIMHEVQDSGMKGFAVGAFFVTDNRLFFIKNRNEVCIYSM